MSRASGGLWTEQIYPSFCRGAVAKVAGWLQVATLKKEGRRLAEAKLNGVLNPLTPKKSSPPFLGALGKYVALHLPSMVSTKWAALKFVGIFVGILKKSILFL